MRKTVRPALVALACLVVAPAIARAQEHHGEEERPPTGDETEHHDEHHDEGPRVELPWRILASLGASAAVRIVTDPALQQTTLTPGYLEARGGVVFPGADFWRHGATVSIATNLAIDGPIGTQCAAPHSYCSPLATPMHAHAFDAGFNPFGQWVITPSYLAYFRLSEDFVATGRFGVPIAVAPYTVLGFELAGSIAWMLTAGLGVFVEAQFDIYLGIDTYAYPTVGGAAGIEIDYEVLP